ncbi:MAG: hypothetical protein FJW83_00380 [Actinobacteria bacterium]|nr:hypothetical protein [Actinomycetota bacterium]
MAVDPPDGDARAHVAGLDESVLRLVRADWLQGCLRVQVEAPELRPDRRTMFRIVGVEPRIWYVTGINGVTTDTASAATLVWTPIVSGTIEFTPGSY